MNAKKIIIIMSVILGVAALAVGIYFAWKNSQTILTPPQSQPGANGGGISINQPGVSTGLAVSAEKMKIVSKKEVFDYWIFNPVSAATSTAVKIATSTSVKTATSTASTTTVVAATPAGAGIYYLGLDGKIFKVNADGDDKEITAEGLSDIQEMKASFDGKRVIIKYGTLISPTFKIFNTETGMFETAPSNITAADFSPDGKKLAYLETSGDKSNLITKDLTNLKLKPATIISIYQKDFDLNWISAGSIVLTPKPTAFYGGAAWLVDINKKILNKLPTAVNGEDGRGLMLNWSSDGKLGLEFIEGADGRNRYLNLVDGAGKISANLGFITLPGKCFVSDPQIYCAIPDNIPERTALPDDYLKKAIYFADSLYLVDITPGSEAPISLIFDGGGMAMDAVNLKLADGKLFFINRYDEKLYSLDLK